MRKKNQVFSSVAVRAESSPRIENKEKYVSIFGLHVLLIKIRYFVSNRGMSKLAIATNDLFHGFNVELLTRVAYVIIVWDVGEGEKRVSEYGDE